MKKYPYAGKFRHLPEVQETGKKFPVCGKLRSIATYHMSGFGYLTDDAKFVWVELKPAAFPDLSRHMSNMSGQNSQLLGDQSKLKKLSESYLNAWGPNVEN